MDQKHKVWYLDEKQLEFEQNIRKPLLGQVLGLFELQKMGIFYEKLNGEETNHKLEQIAKQRHYINRDLVKIGKGICENYDQLVEQFKTEHLHMDEEIRYILGGSGYFDVRSLNNKWVRIFVEKGDMIILPEGIYHRFTTDSNDYIHAMRLFKKEPKWTAYKRPCDDNESRIKYFNQYIKPKADLVQ